VEGKKNAITSFHWVKLHKNVTKKRQGKKISMSFSDPEWGDGPESHTKLVFLGHPQKKAAARIGKRGGGGN